MASGPALIPGGSSHAGRDDVFAVAVGVEEVVEVVDV